MILVTGATGHLGAAAIEQLLKHTAAGNIVAFARDISKAKHLTEQGIEVRTGSFDDTASLQKAMQGIHKVLLVSGVDANRLQQHQHVADAAKADGVQHIVYTSVALHDLQTSANKGLMQSHFDTEDYIKQSGMAYTILRNTLYTDGIPLFVGEKVLATGIFLPAGKGKVPFALRREMGEAAANVLLQDGHQMKTYELTATDLYTYEDVARELSVLSGKPVTYTDADASTYANTFKGFGVPEPVVQMISAFLEDSKNGQFEIAVHDLEQLLGRKPASLRKGLAEIYNF